jgi:hypothetical protein
MSIDKMPLSVCAFLILRVFNVALQMHGFIFDPFGVDQNTQQFKSALKFHVY